MIPEGDFLYGFFVLVFVLCHFLVFYVSLISYVFMLFFLNGTFCILDPALDEPEQEGDEDDADEAVGRREADH